MAARFRNALHEADRADIVGMGDSVVHMLRQVKAAFTHLDARPLDEALRTRRDVHRREQALISRMVGRAAAADAGAAAEEVVFVPMHIERIADNVELLAASTGTMVREGILFTDRAVNEVGSLFDTVLEVLEGLRDAARTGNRTLVRYVLDASRTCEARASEFARFHEQRMIEGVCVPRASSVYLAMLDQLKAIEWHARQIAEKFEPEPDGPDQRAARREADR